MVSVDTAIIVAVITVSGSVILAVINTGFIQPWRARKDRNEEQKNRKEELQNALYSEMIHSYCLLKEVYGCLFFKKDDNGKLRVDYQRFSDPHNVEYALSHPEQKGENDIPQTIRILNEFQDHCFDVYNFTRNDPVLFYQLPDAHEIDVVYRNYIFNVNEIINMLSNLERTSPSQADIKAKAEYVAHKMRTSADWLKKYILDFSILSGIEISLLTKFVHNEPYRPLMKDLEEAYKDFQNKQKNK